MKYREMEVEGRDSPAEVERIKGSAAKGAVFSVIFISAVGVGTLGSAFGIPGTQAGIAVGVAIGVLIKGKQKNG